MKFSKKSRYGMRALIDLTVNSKDGHVPLNSIAERNSISPQYLEQVFASLRKAGIVKSIKGPQGGYLLNRSPEEITAAEVVKALEGDYRLEPEDMSGDNNGHQIAATLQTFFIDKVNEQTDNILKEITLADLVADYRDQQAYESGMYYI